MSLAHIRLSLLTSVVGLSLLTASLGSASASRGFEHDFWTFFSETGTILYLGAGVGAPLIEDGRAGKNHTLRAADALGTSLLLSEGLKSLIQERRPDTGSHDSFPSGHATAAFSVATIETALHPRQGIYWYAGATLIAASRVGLHRHTVGDVLAGAVLGYGVSRLEISARRGLLLAPFIQPERHAYGLSFSKSF